VIWAVYPHSKKYWCFPPTQITFKTPDVPPTKGRFAIVTNAGWDAVDAAVPARKVDRRAVFRERWQGAQTNGTAAYGKSVWS
jgi:hypothetical protein